MTPHHAAALAALIHTPVLAGPVPPAGQPPAPPRVTRTTVAPGLGLTDITLLADGATDARARYTDAAGTPRDVPLLGTPPAARLTVAAGGAVEVSAALPGGVSYRRSVREDTPSSTASWRTPAWAMGRVWYQVFPERFRNGEPANDPAGLTTHTLPWLSDWWEVTPEEIEAAWARAAAMPSLFRTGGSDAGGAFNAVVFARRYGGDLQGVVRQLDHMQDLGIDGLYLCPVFQSRSLHKYDAADHRHVDAAFGGSSVPPDIYEPDPVETDDPRTWRWTDADRYLVDVLLPAARARGMRVILDGVWNHVGLDHFAFADVLRNGRASRYADWFAVDFTDDGRVSGWQAWDGRNGGLPEFRQTAEGDLAPGPKAHVMAVTHRWMDPDGDGDPSDGVDGWRLDVAAEIGRPFWRDWRAHVKRINPDALIIAELWFDGAAYYDGTAFDGQMHYPFAFAVTAWLGRDPGYDASRLAADLSRAFGARPQVDLVQHTLLASHDTERLASMLDNPGREYDRGAGTEAVFDGSYRAGPASARARRLSILGCAMQALCPGSPMIYAGDELGLAGADDPHNRQPIVWPEMREQVPIDRRPSASVHEAYRGWLRLRAHPLAGPILRYGAFSVSEVAGTRAVRIERSLDGVRVVAVVNPADDAVRVSASGSAQALIGSPGQAEGVSASAWVETAP